MTISSPVCIKTRLRNPCKKGVEEKGCTFGLRDGVDGHHGTLRWEMLAARDQQKVESEMISIGFAFPVLGGDRVRAGSQFIES